MEGACPVDLATAFVEDEGLVGEPAGGDVGYGGLGVDGGWGCRERGFVGDCGCFGD